MSSTASSAWTSTARSGCDVVVHFRSVYELSRRARSVTAAASSRPSSSSSSSSLRLRGGGGARVVRVRTPSESDEDARLDGARHRRRSSSSDSDDGYASPHTSDTPHHHRHHRHHHRSSHHTRDNDNNNDDVDDAPLTTLDKRELSKIVLRDAVYAQLLDVVPSRQCITTTLYTLGATTLLVDGVVRGARMRDDADDAHDNDNVDGSNGGGVGNDTTRRREILVQRVAVMAADATLYEAALRPYLGPEGSAGYLTSVQVDGLELLLSSSSSP